MATKVQIAAAWVFLVPALAHAGADEDHSDLGCRKSRLQADLGVASAVGEIGASYTYAPVPEVELEVGAGLGASGYQLSAMPKLSLGSATYRLVLGAGLSTSLDSGNNPSRSYVGYWLNVEAGYEYRSPAGYSVLVAVGVTRGIGGSRRAYCGADCGSEPAIWDRQVAGEMYPQGRIAVGRWF